jgi:tetratricopeptide (TPR) repeat protein
VRAAPSDETLYSNRSATLAKLERYNEALADGKRCVSINPEWGKGYSRAGLAALNGGDEESAYWSTPDGSQHRCHALPLRQRTRLTMARALWSGGRFYANGLKKEPSNNDMLKGRDACIRALMTVSTARYRRRVERFKRDAERKPARVFAVSDVHYDHPGAKEWAANLSKSAYKDDAIIVAGDVGDTYTAVKYCLRAFKAVFRRVFCALRPLKRRPLTIPLTIAR